MIIMIPHNMTQLMLHIKDMKKLHNDHHKVKEGNVALKLDLDPINLMLMEEHRNVMIMNLQPNIGRILLTLNPQKLEVKQDRNVMIIMILHNMTHLILVQSVGHIPNNLNKLEVKQDRNVMIIMILHNMTQLMLKDMPNKPNISILF